MKRSYGNVAAALVLLVACLATRAPAQRRIIAAPNHMAGPGVVNLPYMINDPSTGIWRIYNGGWMQQQGGMSLVGQGAMLMINGQQVNQNNSREQAGNGPAHVRLTVPI